jgi:hypothetical protein
MKSRSPCGAVFSMLAFETERMQMPSFSIPIIFAHPLNAIIKYNFELEYRACAPIVVLLLSFFSLSLLSEHCGSWGWSLEGFLIVFNLWFKKKLF